PFAEERPVVANRPAADGRKRAERVVAAKDRRAAEETAMRVPRVDSDRTKLFAEPTVERRRRDRVRVFPKRVDVLARGRQKHRAGPKSQTIAMRMQIQFEICLRYAERSASRALFVARDEVNVRAECW